MADPRMLCGSTVEVSMVKNGDGGWRRAARARVVAVARNGRAWGPHSVALLRFEDPRLAALAHDAEDSRLVGEVQVVDGLKLRIDGAALLVRAGEARSVYVGALLAGAKVVPE